MQTLIEKMIHHLTFRLASMPECIQQTLTLELFRYNDESLVGELISKTMRVHQIARCFNCPKK